MDTERLPPWLKKKLPSSPRFAHTLDMLHANRIETVCENARCPNIFECFAHKSVTFILLGNTCTRKCRYCAVSKGKPEPVDSEESVRISKTIKELSLSSIVLTSVTRDDLSDFGAGHFARVISTIKKDSPGAQIEALVPDFKGDEKALGIVFDAGPDTFGHNLETVQDLFTGLRPQASYEISLRVLEIAHERGFITKSGIMVGFGETTLQINETLIDLKRAGVNIITIGQYLKPDPECVRVRKYYSPEEFASLKKLALNIGFDRVNAGPFVRSSYRINTDG